MRRRNLLLGAAAGVVVAAAAWWGWAKMNPSVRAGEGPYHAELVDCQDRVFADAMHPDDMKFLPNTIWHQVDKKDLYVGGRLTKLNDMGRPMAFDYSCLIRDRRVFKAELR